MKYRVALLMLLGLVLVVVGGVFVYFKFKRYEVVITQEQIDAGLAERFPATKRHLLIFTITYTNPRVDLLEEEDRVRIGMDAELNIRVDGEEKNLGGGMTMTSGIRYDSETQSFYLAGAEIERFAIDGVPEKWLERVTKFASEYAREYIESKPVYVLKAKDAKSAAAKMLLKNVEVRDRAIHVTLGL